MLECKSCKEEKSITGFYRAKNLKRGFSSDCKSCIIERVRVRSSRPEVKVKKAEYDRKRFQDNKESIYEYRKSAPHEIAYNREWSRKRKQSVKDRTPPWACSKATRDMYKLAVKLQQLTGVEYEVDHIIPLHGKDVCGLHVVGNLQILEKSLNRAKRNNFELPVGSYPK